MTRLWPSMWPSHLMVLLTDAVSVQIEGATASSGIRFSDTGLRLWGFLMKDCKPEYHW